MKKNMGKISTLQLSLIITTAVGLKNHVTILPHLLPASKRDGWITVLLALIIILVWCLLLSYINKRTRDQNIFLWLDSRIGKHIGKIMAVAVSITFLILASASLKEMVMWTKVSYLPLTPTFFEILLFTGLCYFLANTNIQTIATVNTFVLSAVVAFGIFVALANIQFKNHSLLRPILENGWDPVFAGLIYPLSGLIELIALLFLQHKTHGSFGLKVFVINAVVLAGLILGPLLGSITEFGPVESARQKYPAFEQWGLVTLGRFIEHLDFLSIYQWLTGAFIRVSFFLFLSLEVLSIKKKRNKKILLSIFCLILIAASLVEIRDSTLAVLIKTVIMPGTFYFFFVVSILIAILVLIGRRKGRRPSSDVQQQEETSTVQSD